MNLTIANPRAVGVALRRRGNTSQLSAALLACAFLLWLVSLASGGVERLGHFGLLSELPVAFFLAIGVLVVSTTRAIVRNERSPILAAHIGLFLVIVHGTPALLYDNLRYSWAWRHLGVVDYLAQTHTVDPNATSLPIYQSWPGFFASASTWLAGSGADAWTGAAQWAPLFFQAMSAAAVYVLMTKLTANRRVVWLTVWLFALGNWVGQDYFSPQAFAYFLYLATLAVVVHWFGPSATAGRDVRGALLISVLLIAAIVTVHPLTSVVLVTALALLALLRATTLRELPFVAFALTVLWALTAARTYIVENGSTLLGDIGKVGASVDASMSKSVNAADAQRIVSLAGRAGLVCLVLAAAAGFVLRLRAHNRERVATALALAPLAIFVVSSYGGEAAFRVYLFALPFLAYFAAIACLELTNRWRWDRVAAGVLALVLTVAFLFGYYGKDAWAHFEPGEVRAAAVMYADAEPGSLIVEGTRSYPREFVYVEYLTYVNLASEPEASARAVFANPADVLAGWLASTRYPRGYVIITRSQRVESDELGYFPPGSLARVERALLTDPRFTALYHDDDASLFTLAPPAERPR